MLESGNINVKNIVIPETRQDSLPFDSDMDLSLKEWEYFERPFPLQNMDLRFDRISWDNGTEMGYPIRFSSFLTRKILFQERPIENSRRGDFVKIKESLQKLINTGPKAVAHDFSAARIFGCNTDSLIYGFNHLRDLLKHDVAREYERKNWERFITYAYYQRTAFPQDYSVKLTSEDWEGMRSFLNSFVDNPLGWNAKFTIAARLKVLAARDIEETDNGLFFVMKKQVKDTGMALPERRKF